MSSNLATPNELSVPSASEGKFGLKCVILQHQNAHLLLNVEDLILPKFDSVLRLGAGDGLRVVVSHGPANP